jgi:hypothetical protein
MRLHVVGVTADGRMWRAIRYAGSWRAFFDVESAAGERGAFAACSCAQVGVDERSGTGHLHIVGATTEGRLWHAVRHPSGWEPFADIESRAGERGRFVDVACAEVAGNLHVVAVTDDSQAQETRVWHTIRYSNSWQPFDDIEWAAGDRGNFVAVDCAGIGEQLHVVGVTADGRLWHAIRYPTWWQPFNDVEQSLAGGERGHHFHIACAGIGDNLHVCAQSLEESWRYVLWHAIRFPTWWQPFNDVGRPGEPNLPFDVACAGIEGDLHVCLTTDTYVTSEERDEGQVPEWHLWHTVRHPNSWQPFGDVELAAGERCDFVTVACTGVNTPPARP